MNFIYVIHFLCWKHLTDLITHNRNNRSNTNNKGCTNNQRGRARYIKWNARPLLLFLLPLLLLLLLLFLLCVIRSVRWFQYNKWMT